MILTSRKLQSRIRRVVYFDSPGLKEAIGLWQSHPSRMPSEGFLVTQKCYFNPMLSVLRLLVRPTSTEIDARNALLGSPAGRLPKTW